MLESSIMKKYQVARKQAFLPAVIRALHLHRRLSSILGLEEPLFKWCSLATGKFDVSERGVRHELWDALRDLEFFILWQESRGPASSPKRTQPTFDNKQDSALMRTHSDGRLTDQPPRFLQGETTQGHGKSSYGASSPSVIPVASAYDQRWNYVSAFWPRALQERYAPARWASTLGKRGDQGRSEHREAGHGAGSVRAPVASFLFATHIRLGRLGIIGRDPHSADGAATGKDRPAATPTLFSPVSFPVSRSASLAAKESGSRSIADQGDIRDVTWRFLVSQSQGTALGIFQRVLLEPFFPDMDLGAVRIHTDEPADRAARSLRADAFSLGGDIYFRAHRFNPATSKGLALLGHELVHTRQTIGGEPFPAVGQRKEMELEAEITEASFLRGFTVAGIPRTEQRAMPFGGGGKTYAPLSLEPMRVMPSLPKGGGVVRGGERTMSLSTLSGGNGSAHPLKAEEERSAPAGAGSAAASPSSSDDQDAATRALFRALERKLQIEKERRGVDRWVH